VSNEDRTRFRNEVQGYCERLSGRSVGWKVELHKVLGRKVRSGSCLPLESLRRSKSTTQSQYLSSRFQDYLPTYVFTALMDAQGMRALSRPVAPSTQASQITFRYHASPKARCFHSSLTNTFVMITINSCALRSVSNFAPLTCDLPTNTRAFTRYVLLPSVPQWLSIALNNCSNLSRADHQTFALRFSFLEHFCLFWFLGWKLKHGYRDES